MGKNCLYKNILVDACMHLGDLIHATTLIPLLKEIYPNAKISFLVNAGLESLFENIGEVNKVIPYEYKSGGSYFGVFQMAQKLKQEKFDLSISLDPRTRLSAMTWLAGIPRRAGAPLFGWKPGIERFFFSDYFYLHDVNLKKTPMAYCFQDFVRRFAVSNGETRYVPRFIDPPRDASAYISDVFHAIPDDKLKIALCVKTAQGSKDWNPQNFRQLLKRILASYDVYVIGVGVKADKETFAEVIDGVDNERIVNMVGKTNLAQLNALFKKCDLLINPDNGMGHFAAAAGCPTVTLFINASPVKYKPLHILTEAIFNGDIITVDDVFASFEKLIFKLNKKE